MDFLTFFATLIQALAWPTTVVVIVIILRADIAKLLADIRTARYKGLQVDFGREIGKVEAKGKELPSDPQPAATPAVKPALPESNERDAIRELARLSPASAVVSARVQLEHGLNSALRELDPSKGSQGSHSIGRAIEELSRKEVLDSETREVLDGLRRIGNQAAHAFPKDASLTESDAVRYYDTVIRALKSVQRQIVLRHLEHGTGIGH